MIRCFQLKRRNSLNICVISILTFLHLQVPRRSTILLAQEQQVTGTIFNHLFKQAITFAKRAHSQTDIGKQAVSVSYAAVELGKKIFGQFDHKHVLVLGAGKMSELTAKQRHKRNTICANK